MTAIAIALGMIALFWIASTNFGADSDSGALKQLRVVKHKDLHLIR